MIVHITANIAGFTRGFCIDTGDDMENFNKKYIVDSLLNSKMSLSIRERFIDIVTHFQDMDLAMASLEKYGDAHLVDMSFSVIEIIKPETV